MEILHSMLPLKSEWLNWSDGQSLAPIEAKLVSSTRNEETALHLLLSEKKFPTTSLLFQAAVTHCTAGRHVVFITTQPINKLPAHIHGMPQPRPEALSQLKMLYLSTLDELIAYLADVHRQPCLPELIIVGQLNQFAVQVPEGLSNHTMAKICSFLVDSSKFISKKVGTRCQVLASVEEGHDKYISVCLRYAETILRLSLLEPEEPSSAQVLTLTPHQQPVPSGKVNLEPTPVIEMTHESGVLKLLKLSNRFCHGNAK